MGKSNRNDIIALQCEVCGEQNYTEYKLKNVHEKRKKMKYCPKCRKHTMHLETKVK